jgi:hypothetical protein
MISIRSLIASMRFSNHHQVINANTRQINAMYQREDLKTLWKTDILIGAVDTTKMSEVKTQIQIMDGYKEGTQAGTKKGHL